MAIAFVRQATANGALPSQPVTITASTAGNALILIISYATGATNAVTGVTDNASNAWAKAAEGWLAGSSTRVEIWYVLNATSATTVTVAKPTTSAAFVNVSEWSGVATTAAFDTGTGGGEASSTSKTAGPISTAFAPDLVIAGVSYPSGTATATLNTAGYTALTGGLNGTQTGAFAYQIVSSAGSYSVNWTLSAAATGGNAIASFKAVGAVAAPLPDLVTAYQI